MRQAWSQSFAMTALLWPGACAAAIPTRQLLATSAIPAHLAAVNAIARIAVAGLIGVGAHMARSAPGSLHYSKGGGMRMRRAAIVLSVCSGLAGLLSTSATEAAAPADIVIDDTYVFPESMSAARDGSIYIGSMKGIIFRARPHDSKAEPWIRPTPANGLLSVLGVLADERSRTLWVCSAPSALRTPPAVGTTSLMAFDLRTGAPKGAYPFPAPGGI